MHMALASCSSLAAADAAVRFFPASMAYHRHPCSGGGGLSSSTFFGGAAAAFPQQPAFGPADLGLAAPPQLRDAFERLLSDEGVSSVAVPGTFGTTPPPPRPPRMSFVEQVVPDASAYAHASRGATAVAGERSTTRTATDDRIAFRVRSEEEVLDDGYKWRKYGKKSVKNSPNPRNYYRCSTEGCNVKKRVERDRDDPSYVVTMYEGVHNHVSPGTIYYATQDATSGRFFVAGMHFGPC